jgi:hypothetical protein
LAAQLILHVGHLAKHHQTSRFTPPHRKATPVWHIAKRKQEQDVCCNNISNDEFPLWIGERLKGYYSRPGWLDRETQPASFDFLKVTALKQYT